MFRLLQCKGHRDQIGVGGDSLRAVLLQVDGKAVSLPPKEFDLPVKLAEHERIVFSREQLLDQVWGFDYFGDTRTVDAHIKSLREHLGPYRRGIETSGG